jgi:hypothetical protein
MDEALVRRLWLAGGWPADALRATDGTLLHVIYPGRPGHGAGPDLLDAIVALPDATLRHGDVELHVHASDWRSHRHAGDSRYAAVILHVVWRDDLAGPIDLGNGAPGPLTVALANLPETLLFERLRCPAPAPEPYHDWLRELDDGARGAFLDRLGDERLSARAARLAADLHALGPDETLYRALLDAFGYAQNRAPFGRLAEIVPFGRLMAAARSERDVSAAERACLGLLFGAAGLLDERRFVGLADRAALDLASDYRALARRQAVDRTMPPGAWELIGVRPANRPARRLAALARLAVQNRRDSLADHLLDCFELGDGRAIARALLALARVPGEQPTAAEPLPCDVWSRYHDFGRRLPGAPLALVGEDRARAIVSNVLLPFAIAWADAKTDDRLADAVRSAWAAAPAPAPNWIVSHMRPLAGAIALGARREQGLIELYQRCCRERRCLTCPAQAVAKSLARA